MVKQSTRPHVPLNRDQEHKDLERNYENQIIRKLTKFISCFFLSANSHNPLFNPSHCPSGPGGSAAPEFLFNFRKALFLSPQGLGQRSGAARRLQIFGFVGEVTSLLLISVDVDAVQASEEQQQSQDDNNCG